MSATPGPPPELLRALTVVARASAGHMALGLIAAGVQLFMAIYGMVVYAQTPPSARTGRAMYMAVSVILCMLGVTSAIIAFTRHFTIWFEAASPLEFVASVGTRLVPMVHVTNLASYLCVLIGDGLMMYRCYIIWADKLWVLIAPALTYLASAAFCILLTVFDFQSYGVDHKHYVIPFFSLNVSFNVLVTLLIAGRLIFAQRRLSKLLGVEGEKKKRKLAHITGASAVLIESAVPLSALGVAMVSVYSLENTFGSPGFLEKTVAGVILQALYPIFIVLSPQMIIFRVTTGRSWVAGIHKTLSNAQNQSPSDDDGSSEGALSHQLAFARSQGVYTDASGEITDSVSDGAQVRSARMGESQKIEEKV